MTTDKSSFRDPRGEQVRGSEQTIQKEKTTTSKQPAQAMETRGRGGNQLGSVEQLMLTSPNAPLPITLTVLKSRKPIFVRRSLKNCDCVRVCLLISRIRRSSGTPARDLSSSAPLQHTTIQLQHRAEINHSNEYRQHVRTAGHLPLETCHTPDVQVDCGFERKAVM